MGKILDWFTQFLIEMDDEEVYVELGRRLLSVNKYAVTFASTIESFHEVVKIHHSISFLVLISEKCRPSGKK